MTSQRTVRQYLQMLAAAGVTHVPTVEIPEDVAVPGTGGTGGLRLKRASGPKARSQRPAQATQLKTPEELRPDSGDVPAMLPETREILSVSGPTVPEKSAALAALAKVVAGCSRCTELADCRTQTVFGVGNPDARIMLIGEAPGADEDRQGEPFVGKAGQLLNKIIEACRLKRDEVYICNILRCRPPGNRNPLPQEAANCREFLEAQIKIVKPAYIVCWGTVAAQNLLGETRSIGRLRGQWFRYNESKVLCTYHPSYLLRNPAAKKLVWEDMKLLLAEDGFEGDSE